MTPKEKAKELIDKYYQKYADSSYPDNMAKDCALIAVNDILRVAFYANDEIYNHYLKVKQELEQL
jgi:hypothetical protein